MATTTELASASKDMSIEDMESALVPKFHKRMLVSQTTGGQKARALLEDNKLLIEEKRRQKALARKDEKDFVERILEQDRLTNEGDKARELGKRSAQKELAQHYKAKIAEKEETKANEYKLKVEQRSTVQGGEPQFFTFNGGEDNTGRREVKSARLREEMQAFLQKQRETKPPRSDVLKSDNAREPALQYPVQSQRMPHSARVNRPSAQEEYLLRADGAGLPPQTPAPMRRPMVEERPRQMLLENQHFAPEPVCTSLPGLGNDALQNIAQYPKFLTRAREHMSRRLTDGHVRKALEDKVAETKAELEALAAKRSAEVAQWDDSLLVHDALRYDSSQSKVAECKRHAQYLKEQMQERQMMVQRERAAQKAEQAGYWGPEEKQLVSTEEQRNHCATLIQQMEIDQHRRMHSRNQRLIQERQLLTNCMAEMSQDRQQDVEKARLHREVLTTTWKSQQKIRDAKKTLDVL